MSSSISLIIFIIFLLSSVFEISCISLSSNLNCMITDFLRCHVALFLHICCLYTLTIAHLRSSHWLKVFNHLKSFCQIIVPALIGLGCCALSPVIWSYNSVTTNSPIQNQTRYLYEAKKTFGDIHNPDNIINRRD
jgi:hypothetical protein